MPARRTLLLAVQVALATASPLAARDDTDQSSANGIIERLGGGGPGGQSAVRGFFIGIAFGILLALLCCCWYPCLHMRRGQRRAAARRILQIAIARGHRQRETARDDAAMEAAAESAIQADTTTTAAGRPPLS